MPRQTQVIIATAILSAAIFLIVFSWNMDFLLMFLSAIPLISAGLSRNPSITLKAGALATLPIALISNSLFIVALFFLVFVLPSWYVCYMSVRYYDIRLSPALPSIRLWYPVGLITVNLALYGLTILAVITAVFAFQETSLPQILHQSIETEMVHLQKDYDMQIHQGIKDMSFLLSGLIVWLWCGLLIGYTMLINRTLVKKNLALRPNIIVTTFAIPHWLLSLMGIFALAALIGSESMSFLGKAALVILLIPYFFQGISMVHAGVKNWPNKMFFLIFLYVAIVAFLWPALMVAGIGLWNHIKTYNKHLSSGGSSSRS